MIGVNNLNAPTRTLVRRQSVDYDEAIRRYRNLVPVQEENTVDPAIVPEGRRYDLELDTAIDGKLFFSDNCKNKEKAIYLIAVTDNRSSDSDGEAIFTKENRRAYEKLQNDQHNPMFGLWYDGSEEEQIITPCLDTNYVENNVDDKKAIEIKLAKSQTAILKINPDGSLEMI